jgi:lysozyme family protein
MDKLIFDIVIMKHEGGSKDNASDKHDKGGYTRYGISQLWKDEIDIMNCTEEEAFAFYQKYFFSRIETGQKGLDLFLFDSLVQHDRDACIWLQKALGFTGSALDGIIGEQTGRAVMKKFMYLPNGLDLIKDVAALRMEYYMDLDDDYAERYHKGWSRRFCDILMTSCKMTCSSLLGGSIK